MAEILDACCGGRMWWWDKEHPLATYMDTRTAARGSVGEVSGHPEWNPAVFGDSPQTSSEARPTNDAMVSESLARAYARALRHNVRQDWRSYWLRYCREIRKSA